MQLHLRHQFRSAGADRGRVRRALSGARSDRRDGQVRARTAPTRWTAPSASRAPTRVGTSSRSAGIIRSSRRRTGSSARRRWRRGFRNGRARARSNSATTTSPAWRALFEQHPGQIACLLLEPARLEEPRDDFLPRLKELCHRNGALLRVRRDDHRVPLASVGGAACLRGDSRSVDIRQGNRQRVRAVGACRPARHHASSAATITIGRESFCCPRLMARRPTRWPPPSPRWRPIANEDVVGHLYRQGARLRKGVARSRGRARRRRARSMRGTRLRAALHDARSRRTPQPGIPDAVSAGADPARDPGAVVRGELLAHRRRHRLHDRRGCREPSTFIARRWMTGRANTSSDGPCSPSFAHAAERDHGDLDAQGGSTLHATHGTGRSRMPDLRRSRALPLLCRALCPGHFVDLGMSPLCESYVAPSGSMKRSRSIRFTSTSATAAFSSNSRSSSRRRRSSPTTRTCRRIRIPGSSTRGAIRSRCGSASVSTRRAWSSRSPATTAISLQHFVAAERSRPRQSSRRPTSPRIARDEGHPTRSSNSSARTPPGTSPGPRSAGSAPRKQCPRARSGHQRLRRRDEASCSSPAA